MSTENEMELVRAVIWTYGECHDEAYIDLHSCIPIDAQRRYRDHRDFDIGWQMFYSGVSIRKCTSVAMLYGLLSAGADADEAHYEYCIERGMAGQWREYQGVSFI